jgi:hypothetical protein
VLRLVSFGRIGETAADPATRKTSWSASQGGGQTVSVSLSFLPPPSNAVRLRRAKESCCCFSLMCTALEKGDIKAYKNSHVKKATATLCQVLCETHDDEKIKGLKSVNKTAFQLSLQSRTGII